MRITKVTTKTGDSGETGLGNGERVSKNNPRVHAMGAVDKLNSTFWASLYFSCSLPYSFSMTSY